MRRPLNRGDLCNASWVSGRVSTLRFSLCSQVQNDLGDCEVYDQPRSIDQRRNQRC
jgi:hypothetical protein